MQSTSTSVPLLRRSSSHVPFANLIPSMVMPATHGSAPQRPPKRSLRRKLPGVFRSAPSMNLVRPGSTLAIRHQGQLRRNVHHLLVNGYLSQRQVLHQDRARRVTSIHTTRRGQYITMGLLTCQDLRLMRIIARSAAPDCVSANNQ